METQKNGKFNYDMGMIKQIYLKSKSILHTRIKKNKKKWMKMKCQKCICNYKINEKKSYFLDRKKFDSIFIANHQAEQLDHRHFIAHDSPYQSKLLYMELNVCLRYVWSVNGNLLNRRRWQTVTAVVATTKLNSRNYSICGDDCGAENHNRASNPQLWIAFKEPLRWVWMF